MVCNHLVLDAAVLSRKTLRYTPAGVPALDLELAHQSVQRQGGHDCTLTATVKALAFGINAETLSRLDLGTALQFQGFLTASRNGKSLVFSIQNFHPL